MKGRVAELDGVRGVAILLVLVGHAEVFGTTQIDGAGVVVFFVLSGYLITGLLQDQLVHSGRIDLRRFFTRRAARLAPALLLMLAVMVPLLLVEDVPGTAVGAAASLGYVANIVRAHGVLIGPFGHTWSLSLEEQFYLLWPFILPLILRRRRAVQLLLGLAAVSLLLRFGIGLAGWWEWAAFSPLTTVGPLLLGAALAMRPWPPQRWFGTCGVALLVVACVPIGGVGLWALVNPFYAGVGAALLIVAKPAWTRPRWLQWVGRRSYAIYLWHLPIMWLPQVSGLGDPWSGLVASALSVGIAAVSWRLVEAPALRWARSAPTVTRLPAQGVRVVADRGSEVSDRVDERVRGRRPGRRGADDDLPPDHATLAAPHP